MNKDLEKVNLVSEDLSNDTQLVEEYELEGYAKCSTASRRCEQDCLGGCFMTCDN